MAEGTRCRRHKLQITPIRMDANGRSFRCSSGGSAADYPAAIMVDDVVYLLPDQPSPAEVAEEAITGYTSSYTDTFPEQNGETNFNRELGMPYAVTADGLAVQYNNEWYLCTPME